MSTLRRRSLEFITLTISMLCVGCDPAQLTNVEKALEKSVEQFEQKLELSVDGSTVTLKLEGMDVFLQEEGETEFPETYLIRGPQAILVGAFPLDLRVDYGENWPVLINREITVAEKGGDPREEQESTLTLPNLGKVKVLGGSLIIEKSLSGFNAKTPLSGRVKLKIQTESGERVIEGTIAVKGTTWG